MFWKQRHRDTADGIARELYDWGVGQPITSDETLGLDFGATSACARELRLYQFAALSLALVKTEKGDPSLVPVREGIEKRFYTDATLSADEVRAAMSDLSALLWPERDPRGVVWGHAWYESVGLNERDPTRLTRFSTMWFHFFTAAEKSLKQAEIVEG